MAHEPEDNNNTYYLYLRYMHKPIDTNNKTDNKIENCKQNQILYSKIVSSF